MCETEKHSEIKSGQFMVSKLDDSDSEEEKSESFEEVEPSPGHNGGVPAFDTLQSLFKSLNLAYVNTVSSPKWSHFKGTGFALKRKVRLNNIIWREYHMQYVKHVRPVIVKFQVPSTDTTFMKTQYLVMNGKFWNRHSSKLSGEYRRWRVFFINHLREKSVSSTLDERYMDTELSMDFPSKLQYIDDKDIFNDVSNLAFVDSPHFIEDLMKDFDGSLDLFLDQPFPDPRDMSRLGNSDIMQPALTHLQPESYHCDLVSGLLRQPAMPTIMDEYPSCSNYQPSFYIPQNQPNSPQCVPSSPFHSYPSSQTVVPHSPEYHYPSLTNKQFSVPYPPPASAAIASDCLQFTNQQADVCTSRKHLTLLNALLQKSSRDGQVLQHSISSTSFPGTAAAKAATTPASKTTSVQFKRYPDPCLSNKLIVDFSNKRMTSPPSDLYLEELPTEFVGANLPTEAVCDTLQQYPISSLNDPSRCNYRSPATAFNRFSDMERPISPLTPIWTPSPPPPTASALVQVPRVPSPFKAPHCIDSQNLISHSRRNRCQYYPDPLPYRRPLPLFTETKGFCGGISSAPELYNTCSIPQVATVSPNLEMSAEEEAVRVIKPPSATGVGKTLKGLEESEDHDEEEEGKEYTLNEESENEDADFNIHDTTVAEAEESGVRDEDLQSSFLITPPSTSLSSSPCMGQTVTAGTARFYPSSTEQRRRLSMQSSLKLLLQLIQQNQVEKLQNERTAGGNRTSPHHHHHKHHLQQQKISKAAVLRDSAELIRTQTMIRDQLDKEIDLLKAELTSLQESVNACCDKLPSSKQQVKGMKDSARVWFCNFVATATQANWKFYIFSLIFMEVFETYHEKVCCSTSREVLRRSTVSWLEDCCDLPQLRKLVMQALCRLSTTTNVLQQPSLLPQQAQEAASRLALSLSLSLPVSESSSTSASSSIPTANVFLPHP